MTGNGSVLRYLDQEVMPGIEGLEFELDETISPEEFDEYMIDEEDSLLTEESEELRSYSVEYEGFSFGMSAETGFFEGDHSLGISTESTNRLQSEAVQKLVGEIADSYDTNIRTLGHGEYILSLEDW